MRRQLKTPIETLQRLIELPKVIYDPFEMSDSADQRESNGVCPLIYHESELESISGLSLRCRSIRDMNDFIYHSYALHYISPQHAPHQDIIAQLEIEPADKLAHRESGKPPIYGAHLVLLNITEKIADNNDNTWYDWFRIFRDRTNISHHNKCHGAFEGQLI